jgi:vitamin B12 transporter
MISRFISLLFVGLFLLFPVLAQDGIEGEDFYDDFIFEDAGFTLVASPETTQQKRTITKAEIDRINPPDLPALLEKLGGLSINQNGPHGNAAGVSMRGFSSSRVAVLINGVSVNSPQSGGADLSMIDPGSIEKIEIIYGGSDTKFNISGATGGVINIITIKDQVPGYRIDVSLSNLFYFPGTYYAGSKKKSPLSDLLDTQRGQFNFALGDKKKYWTVNWFGTNASNHFIYKDTIGVERRQTGNEVLDTGGSTSFSFNLSDWTRLVLDGDFYYADKNIAGSIISASQGVQHNLSAGGKLLLDSDYIGTRALDTELALSYTFNSLGWETTNNDDLHKIHTLSAINRWGYVINDQFSAKIGGDYLYTYLDSTALEFKDGHEGGVYATVEYAPDVNFLIIPSLKMVFNQNSAIPIPKLGLVYYINDSITLKNNYFRVFRFPTFNDFYWPADGSAEGDPNLKPESGYGGDIIVEYRKPSLFTVEGSVYSTWYEDSITWDITHGIYRPANIGKALFIGSDSRVQSSFSDRVVFSLSYSFLLTYALTGDLTFESDKRIPYQPMHVLGLGVELFWNTGSILLSQHYESTKYTAITNLNEIDSYFTADISLNQKMGNNFTFFCSLNNIFGESYITAEGYPMPGFSINTTIRFNIEGKPHE